MGAGTGRSIYIGKEPGPSCGDSSGGGERSSLVPAAAAASTKRKATALSIIRSGKQHKGKGHALLSLPMTPSYSLLDTSAATENTKKALPEPRVKSVHTVTAASWAETETMAVATKAGGTAAVPILDFEEARAVFEDMEEEEREVVEEQELTEQKMPPLTEMSIDVKETEQLKTLEEAESVNATTAAASEIVEQDQKGTKEAAKTAKNSIVFKLTNALCTSDASQPGKSSSDGVLMTKKNCFLSEAERARRKDPDLPRRKVRHLAN